MLTGTDALTWRKFGALVDGLPPGSALAIEMHGEAATWSVSDHLLATVIDLLQGANWQRHGKGKKPDPFPRPLPKGKQSQKLATSDALKRLAELKRKRDKRRGSK